MSSDAIKAYLTGAASDGAAQSDPDVSLGAWRSSVAAAGLCLSVAAPMSGLRIDYASGGNGAGLGCLRAVSVGSVAWTAPGGTEGAAVAIANGETKILASGAAYVEVTRTSAVALSGQMSVALAVPMGGLFGDVPSAERVAGFVDYRCVCLRNDSGVSVSSLALWAESPFELGLDAAGATTGRAAVDFTGMGDRHSPYAVTFGAYSVITPLAVGTLTAGQMIFVWIRRTVAGGVSASVGIEALFSWAFTGGSGSMALRWRVADDSLAQMEVYRGAGGAVNYATPWQTFAIGATLVVALAPLMTYRLVTRRRNAYGLLTHNTAEYVITLDAAGEVVTPHPSAPEEVTVVSAGAGAVKVTAFYRGTMDGENAADSFLVYLRSNGTNPNVGTDTPTVVALYSGDGLGKLEWTSAAFADGADVRVIVRTRRTGPPASDSTNTNIVSLIVDTDGPVAVHKGCGMGRQAFAVIWQQDADNRIEWENGATGAGVLRFRLGGVVVAAIGASRKFQCAKYSEFPFTIEMPQTAAVVWDAMNHSMLFSVGGYRVAELLPAGTFVVSGMREDNTFPVTQMAAANIEEHSGNLDFSVDLLFSSMRLEPVTVGGVHNAILAVREISEYA